MRAKIRDDRALGALRNYAGDQSPAVVFEYNDPLEGFRGWFVRDRLDHRICAGGMRVQPGLCREHLTAMARNMTRKMRMANLRVDGAKCGIDYNPSSPGKEAAMARFLAALRPLVESTYSMGPDLNVGMETLERVAAGIGIPSVKMAVARAQGWDMDEFQRREEVLKIPMADGWTLGDRRAGHGVAAAVLSALAALGRAPGEATVALQGFGALARACLKTLSAHGVRLVAVADVAKCFHAAPGESIDPSDLFRAPIPLLPEPPPAGGGMTSIPREEVLFAPCDVLIPAAVEGVITEENAHRIRARAIVPGANLAITTGAADFLHEKRILVLPDFLSGCGGSLSMDGLFGPRETPRPEEVLDHIMVRMTSMVQEVLARSLRDGAPPTVAAIAICAERRPAPDTPPYGPLSPRN